VEALAAAAVHLAHHLPGLIRGEGAAVVLHMGTGQGGFARDVGHGLRDPGEVLLPAGVPGIELVGHDIGVAAVARVVQGHYRRQRVGPDHQHLRGHGLHRLVDALLEVHHRRVEPAPVRDPAERVLVLGRCGKPVLPVAEPLAHLLIHLIHVRVRALLAQAQASVDLPLLELVGGHHGPHVLAVRALQVLPDLGQEDLLVGRVEQPARVTLQRAALGMRAGVALEDELEPVLVGILLRAEGVLGQEATVHDVPQVAPGRVAVGLLEHKRLAVLHAVGRHLVVDQVMTPHDHALRGHAGAGVPQQFLVHGLLRHPDP